MRGRGRLAEDIVQRGGSREIHIRGFDGHDIVLGAEKAKVTAFAPRGVFSGSEGKLLWL